MTIPTLDSSRTRKLQLTKVIKPDTKEVIPGEGLPLPRQPTTKGDLIVKFDVQFPDVLTKEQKDVLSSTLH